MIETWDRMMEMQTLWRGEITEDVVLQGGAKLKKGTVVNVWSEVDEGLGISWTDRDGNHSMAIEATKVRELGPPVYSDMSREELVGEIHALRNDRDRWRDQALEARTRLFYEHRREEDIAKFKASISDALDLAEDDPLYREAFRPYFAKIVAMLDRPLGTVEGDTLRWTDASGTPHSGPFSPQEDS